MVRPHAPEDPIPLTALSTIDYHPPNPRVQKSSNLESKKGGAFCVPTILQMVKG